MKTFKDKQILIGATFKELNRNSLNDVLDADDLVSSYKRISAFAQMEKVGGEIAVPAPIAAMKKFKTHTVHATRLGPDCENLYEPYRK